MRFALACVALLAGCASPDVGDKADLPLTGGTLDGQLEIHEVGPLESGVTSRLAAYRVESFGGTRLTLSLSSIDDDALLAVEGPLDAWGDAIAPGGGTVVAIDDDGGEGTDAQLDVTLSEPGLYRVLALTYGAVQQGEAPTGALTLDAQCTARCQRDGMTIAELFAIVRRDQGAESFRAFAEDKIATLVPDPAQRDASLSQLRAAFEGDGDALSRFPLLPLAQVGTLRPGFGLLPDAAPPAPDAVLTGGLEEMLAGCVASRELPPPVDPRVPSIRYTSIPDHTLTLCQIAQSEKLAAVLSALSLDNGSQVTLDGETLRTPEALVRALIASGHRVTVANERSYAEFLAFTDGERDVIWPGWMDTGIELENGESLTVPMGHSQHAWRIEGPLVDARIKFYLGISGASFMPNTWARAAWAGLRTAYVVSSDDDPNFVIRSFEAGAMYLRRVRAERETVARGLPADGYGYVGVCNDSTAVIEQLTAGTVSVFPLMRAAELDDAPDLADGLDATLRDLPKDGDHLDRADAIRRILAMDPFPPGSDRNLDATLQAQLRLLRGDRGL